MNLEKIVCTPEQSRQFAELGLFEDSVFVWVEVDESLGIETAFSIEPHPRKWELRPLERRIGPAPTMQEIGEWLWDWKEQGETVTARWSRGQELESLDPLGEDAEYLAAAILQIINDQRAQQAQIKFTMGLARKLEEQKQ